MKYTIIHIFILTGMAVLFSCSLLEPKQEEEVVARVLDQYLYKSDVIGAIPEGTRKADSLVVVSNFIDKWVRKQLMLAKAEEALSEEQKDVNKQIEEYRSSLLIYSYRQKLLQQKMDTVVTEDQIQSYYESNIDNFILSQEIVRAIFVKVPLSAPDINNVRQWTRSGEIDDLDRLEKYCINYAEKFDVFNNSWIYFEALMKQIPMNVSQPGRFLTYNKNMETSDSEFHYFVHIYEFKQEGDTKPLDLIREDIKSILLNKRKIEFYNDLEKQVYNEGVNRNQFEIY
ncbi:peptidyl-prolyl cis-trans isomerase [Bacteroidota bacterium]